MDALYEKIVRRQAIGTERLEAELLFSHIEEVLNLITSECSSIIEKAAESGFYFAHLLLYTEDSLHKKKINFHRLIEPNGHILELQNKFSITSLMSRLESILSPFKVEIHEIVVAEKNKSFRAVVVTWAEVLQSEEIPSQLRMSQELHQKSALEHTMY